jgi:hypothetical protein
MGTVDNANAVLRNQIREHPASLCTPWAQTMHVLLAERARDMRDMFVSQSQARLAEDARSNAEEVSEAALGAAAELSKCAVCGF